MRARRGETPRTPPRSTRTSPFYPTMGAPTAPAPPRARAHARTRARAPTARIMAHVAPADPLGAPGDSDSRHEQFGTALQLRARSRSPTTMSLPESRPRQQRCRPFLCLGAIPPRAPRPAPSHRAQGAPADALGALWRTAPRHDRLLAAPQPRAPPESLVAARSRPWADLARALRAQRRQRGAAAQPPSPADPPLHNRPGLSGDAAIKPRSRAPWRAERDGGRALGPV